MWVLPCSGRVGRPRFAAMSKLSHADVAFVERRRARAAIGLFGLPLLLLLVVAGWGALYVWAPDLVNPLRAGDRYVGINSQAASEAEYAAIYINLAFVFLSALLVSGVAFAFVERRYRKLVDRLATLPAEAGTAPASASRTGV
jgi:hypothetical protein